MRLNDGARLVFHTRPQHIIRELYGPEYRHVVSVAAVHPNRWTDWRFEILIQDNPNAWGMELKIHQWRGWSGFEQAAEVFQALAELDEMVHATVFDVFAALEKAGAVRTEEE